MEGCSQYLFPGVSLGSYPIPSYLMCVRAFVCARACLSVSDGETGSRRENACTCITASSCGDPSDMDTLSRGDPISLYLAASKTQNFGKHILEILAYRCAAHRISCWIKVSKV